MIPAPNRYSRFLRKKLADVIDEVESDARHNHYSVNVLDEVLRNNIDVDTRRLNLRVDDHTIIREIFIG